MQVRLGDLLVARGVLSEDQRQRILHAQQHNARPFGELAERLFGVDPSHIEQAWAAQYARLAEHIDPRVTIPSREALELIERRQAWQFRVLPMRIDGHELVVCTAEAFLARALRFVGWRISGPCSFVMTDPIALGDALSIWYPMAGLDARTLIAAA